MPNQPTEDGSHASWSPADRFKTPAEPGTDAARTIDTPLAVPHREAQREISPVVAPKSTPHRATRSAPVLSPQLKQLLAAVIAFVCVVYLALSGGGYDIVLRSEIGVVIWWLILLGAIVGLLPRSRFDRYVWLAFGLFTAFLIWSWLGLGWSASHEITRQELGRLATYLGVLVLVVCAIGPETRRSLLAGLAAAIAVVAGIAVLSKLLPSLYPTDTAAKFYSTARLGYPFDYADAVGEFAALGVPLLLYFATDARTLLGRVLAGAGAPITLLCLAMTVSRGGILALIVGTIVFFALIPDRISRLPIVAVIVAAAGILLAAVVARPALRDSAGVAPASQRHSMLAIIIVIALLSAAATGIIATYGRRIRRPEWLVFSPARARRGGLALLAAVAVVIVVAVASGATGKLWHNFKQPNPTAHSDQYLRLFSLSGSHRYQYWQVAFKAFDSSPLHGIGAGGFRFYWAQHQTLDEYVVNAHSLWIETLAETGIIGALLLVGFFVVVLFRGGRLALNGRPSTSDSESSADQNERALMAGATAAVAAFCAAAAFDWVWQIGVIPMTMLAIAASVLVGGEGHEPRTVAASGPRLNTWVRQRLFWRGGLVVAALVALWLIVIPLATTLEVRKSQSDAARGDMAAALEAANSAHSIQPSASSPLLQKALLLEQLGDLNGAARAIDAAIARAPKTAQMWLIASRIATEADQPQAALADYREARALDPYFSSF